MRASKILAFTTALSALRAQTNSPDANIAETARTTVALIEPFEEMFAAAVDGGAAHITVDADDTDASGILTKAATKAVEDDKAAKLAAKG